MKPAPPKTTLDPLELLNASLDATARAFDPFGIMRASLAVQQAWLTHPLPWSAQLFRLGSETMLTQWRDSLQLLGFRSSDVERPVQYDERFQALEWKNNSYFDSLKEYYLLYTRWLEDTIYATPNCPPEIRERTAFWARQGLNALAPSNFFWTNPTAVKRFYESGGQSLVQGARHFLRDCKNRTIRMVDDSKFELGRDFAATPGQVVFRNALFELIQYMPTTEQTRTIPLVFIPPWINKYYILDLGELSMVRFLVERGYTVFMISWKNPTPDMKDTSMDDYLLRGALTATEVARTIAKTPAVHAVGYCIGGTLLTALLAWLQAEPAGRAEQAIRSWSLFATLTDFSHPGDIEVFVSADGIRHLERMMEAQGGFLSGRQLADTFRLLRSNSLIWHYFVHNYLYGEELPVSSVLAWNMDSTRLPAAMHSFYLREFYLKNRLVQPNAIKLGGRGIDISKIDRPLYMVAAEQDHITPWQQTFKLCAYSHAPVRHVLATSGHILGIVSPPVQPPKRRYWVGDASRMSDPQLWRSQCPKVPGSWWEDWDAWLVQQCGELRAATAPGSAEYPPIEPAPGRYVREH